MRPVVKSMCRFLFMLSVAVWLALSPRPASAQLASSCSDFWTQAAMNCMYEDSWLCGGDCFEYANCPIGCSPEEWCCGEGFDQECCETAAFGWYYCCW